MKWLDSGLLYNPIKYGLCLTERDYLRTVRSRGISNPRPFVIDGASGTTHFFLDQNDNSIAIVCIKEALSKDPIVVAGLLVHEGVHIWQEILKCMGEDHPSSEFEAYSIQWISQQLMWAYSESLN